MAQLEPGEFVDLHFFSKVKSENKLEFEDIL